MCDPACVLLFVLAFAQAPGVPTGFPDHKIELVSAAITSGTGTSAEREGARARRGRISRALPPAQSRATHLYLELRLYRRPREGGR